MRRAALALVALTLGCGLGPAPAPAPRPPARPPGELVEVDALGLEGLVRAAGARLVLVNVWATWCAPCVAELPDLVRLAEDYAARGLALRLVTVDAPAAQPEALRTLRDLGAPGPWYVKVGSDAGFIAAFGDEWSGALPATALYAPDGTLVGFWEGPVDYATLREVLEIVEWPK